MSHWQALFEAARVVVLGQARQPPVGEETAAGLADRAVIALVLRVDDALDRRSAVGAWLLESPVHRHRLVKSGHLLREAAARGRTQTLDPGSERARGRQMEALDLGVGERLGQLQRRQPRRMQ